MGKNLDNELAEAAGIDDTMAVPEPAEPRELPPREPPRTNLTLLGMLLVIGAGVVVLFMFGFKDAAVYSVPVDSLLASEPTGRRVRVDGELVPGTLVKRDKPCEYRFRIRGETKELEVRYPQCVVPDTFRDVPQGGVMVTAEGKLTNDRHFEASLIMAKCSSKYDPETHTIEGQPASTAQPYDY